MNAKMIPETQNSPSVRLDLEKGSLLISGKSTLPDPINFYSKLLEWLKEVQENPELLKSINIKLTYLNTGSSKWIFHIFKQMEGIHAKNGQLVINWYYENDDEHMQEIGMDYQSMLKVPIKLIPEEGSDC